MNAKADKVKPTIHPELMQNVPYEAFATIREVLESFKPEKFYATREFWESEAGRENLRAIRELVRLQKAMGMNKKTEPRRDPQDILNYRGELQR